MNQQVALLAPLSDLKDSWNDPPRGLSRVLLDHPSLWLLNSWKEELKSGLCPGPSRSPGARPYMPLVFCPVQIGPNPLRVWGAFREECP